MATKVKTVKIKVTLPVDVVEDLKVEALGERCNVGDVIAVAVKRYPKRFALVRRDRGQEGPGLPGQEGPKGQGDRGRAVLEFRGGTPPTSATG